MKLGDTDSKELLDFPSKQHTERNAAWLGIALGVTFTLCFATGLLSHLIQHPPSWFAWSSTPSWGYRASQGIHVVSGFTSIPLLLAKLWVVGPKFFSWPPVRGIGHALERLSLLPLVAGGLFLLISGVINTARFYPWDFYFPAAHYTAAWITIGALIVHVALKSNITKGVVFRREDTPMQLAHSRRWFLGSVGAAGGLFAAATLGNTVKFLSPLAALGQRIPGFGPQGLPVQTTASTAGVHLDPEQYRLRVTGNVKTPLTLSLADLQAMGQHSAELPIACVEGWSSSAHWSGVRVRELLDRAGAHPNATATAISAQRVSRYRTSELNESHAHDPDTLLALELNGEVLHADHGAPVRLIGPNRPGVMQTKWVTELRVR